MTGIAALAADLGYRAGWAAVRYAPERAARTVFDRAGGFAGRRNGGPDQLRRNLARVIGVADPADVPDELVADAVRSYARYWCEAFRLPALDRATVASTGNLPDADHARLDAAVSRGKGVVLALPHTGNWDMAGVWLVQHYGKFATVAERLEPESLFNRFVEYRESLGFEIFPLSGGEQPPFGVLADRLRAGGIVCLLGERDLARHGVPVTFFGERTRMPAGSARLAIETGAALFPAHHWFEEAPYSSMSVGEEIDVSGGVETATQALADAFAENIAAHPADWHMLQPLWEADWTDRQRARMNETGGAA
ncbi:MULTISPECIES: phosphatidylinositol mannoside acyltransferase [Gordonia]|uniref:Lauroyl acyltransferase n=1 Tax=Gordonia alkanivorans CGMCC 6845 TaxID=1423140 RepID=W9DD17_9ACTN|nr:MULTISPECIES: phosphatidylinositol mannoside acyltransferase [Gordonia]ETA06327.1 lauroyl acyltransferase [Gordonia alkanivorans CGMCC 6845]MDH3006522.1 phosphatidylinositol mannoside acyltransferase [Gordonia alkanivorans]MDH3018615.1 phosphatidylinositol mannoside acyltransferase [Gordonia alkanivorans]MDH3023383.1 phosphatidylinositol mannoside acyltransferase [Gordonia alkanivorans]MDH3041320.1 phosphatidylinositol mannoside acyltransferase [Gordonia alkanivorans]